MSTLIGIKYVGLKSFPRQDTAAGTTLVWTDADHVHFVPDNIAHKLLRHPDVWARTEDKAPDSLADLGIVFVETEKPKVQELELPPLVPLAIMDRQALIVYAKTHFGQTLQVNMKEENMRTKIQAWMNSPQALGQ